MVEDQEGSVALLAEAGGIAGAVVGGAVAGAAGALRLAANGRGRGPNYVKLAREDHDLLVEIRDGIKQTRIGIEHLQTEQEKIKRGQEDALIWQRGFEAGKQSEKQP